MRRSNPSEFILLWPSRFLPAIGGVETVTNDLAEELVRKGFQVQIWTQLHDSLLNKYEVQRRIEIRRFLLPLPSRSLRAIFRFVVIGSSNFFLMIKLIRKNRPKVIHLHGLSSNGFYALIISKVFKIPLFLTLHGETLADPNRLFQTSRFMQIVKERVISRAKRISFPSLSTLESASLTAIASKKSYVIPNPIHISQKKQKTSINFPYILYAGRLEWNKGILQLVQTFSSIHEIHPEFRLILVGEGSAEQALRNIIQERGVSEFVHFLGVHSRSEVHCLIVGAEMSILLSERESFGLFALESFYLGTPIIATREGGLPDYLSNKPGCFLVDTQDAKEILDLVQMILINNERMKEAIKRYHQQYRLPRELEIANVTDRYVQWYRSDKCLN